jgi:quercetin dioxygenase-like cupin family protein
MLNLVHRDERRRTTTPNATMTTLMSPTLGMSETISMWEVEMSAGACGPEHVFDSEQAWTVIEGDLNITVGSENTTLGPGDTIVLPAGETRQIRAISGLRTLVCGYGNAIAQVPGEAAPARNARVDRLMP